MLHASGGREKEGESNWSPGRLFRVSVGHVMGVGGEMDVTPAGRMEKVGKISTEARRLFLRFKVTGAH